MQNNDLDRRQPRGRQRPRASARRRAAVALVAALAGGCGAWLAPYRMEIQQGNYLNQEAVGQLRAGMTRDQVRFLLGSPLVTDPFRPERWDYVYMRVKQNSTERESRRIAVFFKDDLVDRIEGDVVAAGTASPPRN